MVGLVELSRRLSDRVPLSVGASRRTLVAFCEIVREAVLAGEEVKLKGVGRLGRVRVPEKRLIHPGTGEPLIVPEHEKPRCYFTDEVVSEIRRRTSVAVSEG